jgi:release factor glutamine methyltransferase
MAALAGIAPGLTVQAALQEARVRLAAGGVAQAALDARLLVMLACGLSAEDIITSSGRPLAATEAHLLEDYLQRRLAGEPVSRIRGWREFWGLRFEITKDTLDPRPESECVVETALALTSMEAKGGLALDLGTGSGCLLIAFLHERPAFRGVAIDLNARALAVARGNAERQGLRNRIAFLCADWLAALAAGSAHVLICNPPYITREDISNLAPDVRNFDPNLALDGGACGLQAYRRIAGDAARVLRPRGYAVFEVGRGQAGAVAELLGNSGFQVLSGSELPLRDLGGVDRVVAARRQ